MNKHFIIFLIAVLVFSCIEEEPLIVTGTAKGIVTDIETGEPLSGASVSMGSAGTKLSDSDGKLRIHGSSCRRIRLRGYKK